MDQAPQVTIVSDGVDIFVLADGRRIAKRGRPGSPQTGTWVSLEPGWVVVSDTGHEHITVERNGVRSTERRSCTPAKCSPVTSTSRWSDDDERRACTG
jgi:hypothetical protein